MSAQERDRPTERIAADAGFDDGVGKLATKLIDAAIDADAVHPEADRTDRGRFDGATADIPDAAHAAAVYTAARIRDIPTRPGEVAAAADADEDRVSRYHSRIVDVIPHTVEPEDPFDWVTRVVDDLSGDQEFHDRAAALCESSVAAGEHVGKSVAGFAASVVYAAGRDIDRDVTQTEAADAASVSELTVRNNYRDVLRHADSTPVRGDRDDIEAAVNDVCDRVDGLPSRVRSDAHELLSAVESADFVARVDPSGVAAGVVYVAAVDARFDVSQPEVATIAGVSKATVVNRVRDIRDAVRRQSFADMSYNRLKEVAAENSVDVGQTPARDYLIDRLVESGVDA